MRPKSEQAALGRVSRRFLSGSGVNASVGFVALEFDPSSLIFTGFRATLFTSLHM